jgi:predicted  nucleic acid-binding Zn-ribbon protein
MNCGNQYPDESEELIEGCECGSSLFVYEKGEEITEDEKEKVTAKMEEMMADGVEQSDNIKFEFDLDSIRVQEEGVYRINVSRLLKEIPLVIRKSEGTYHIHLPSAFDPQTTDLSPSELDSNE